MDSTDPRSWPSATSPQELVLRKFAIMSRATRHLEKLLEALQSDSTLGGCGACNKIAPSTFNSIRASGFDDPLQKETPLSSQISVYSNSESDDPSTLCSGDGSKYYCEETTKLVQQLGDSRVQVVILETQVEFLTNKMEEQETIDSLYIQRLEEEVLRLEKIVEQEMCNLSRRQNQVEQNVPLLKDQLNTIKDALHNFDICEPMYVELKSIPEHQRTAREHILIMAYEKYQHCRKEIQELWTSRDTTREALTQANDEVQRLTRELQRACVNHATDHHEFELELSAHAARIERLEAEQRDSLVQIEVLSAKGALFDEIQAKLEILECITIDAKNQKAIMAATLQMAIQEKESLQDAIKEKDHTLDLLSMDKIHLRKEVHCQMELVKKLEAELEQQHEKLLEVKRARTNLYNKVLADKKDFQIANNQRLEGQTNQNIKKICKEANAIADEKVQTFHEMKDEALATAEMCRSQLQDNKIAYNELLLKFQELQRVAKCKEKENCNNLKVSNFELDQLKVVLKETKNALDQTRLENEAWIAKVKILKEKIYENKNQSIKELEKPIIELKEELQVTRVQLEAYQKEKNAQFKASLREKDAQLKAYQSEKKLQLNIFEREKIKSILDSRIEALDGNESKLKGSLQETKQLEKELRSVIEEKNRMSIRLHLVQEDIRKLLRAQGSVEQLQNLLKEKGVFVGSKSRLKSITTSTKSSCKVKKGSNSSTFSCKISSKISPKISPWISNLDRSATPTKKEL